MKYLIWFLFITCQLETAFALAGPLLDAAKAGNSIYVDRILKSGGDIRTRGRQGESVLHWMVFHGDGAMVKLLIDAGADVNESVNSGSTPLHIAAYNGYFDIAKLLIENGANVNAQTNAGITPLDWADRNGHREAADLLITNGAKHGQISSDYGAKPEQEKTVSKDLKKRLQFNYMTIGHLFSQTSGSAPTTPVSTENGAPVTLMKKGSFRIQLAAINSEPRALEAWQQYRKKHRDILGDQKLILDKINLKGKDYYRVQTGAFSKLVAESTCIRLKRRSQPCIVVNQK